MPTDETNERYLETIYFLSRNNADVHAIDVSRAMGFSKPTVSVKMKKLALEELICVDESEHITLTEDGLKIAKKISERHLTLTEFFISIGVDETTAENDACKIEHDLSDVTYKKLKKFINENK